MPLDKKILDKKQGKESKEDKKEDKKKKWYKI